MSKAKPRIVLAWAVFGKAGNFMGAFKTRDLARHMARIGGFRTVQRIKVISVPNAGNRKSA